MPRGGEDRTGLGIGSGVFDAVYTPDDDALPEVRYGRNYVDKSRWSPEVAQDFCFRVHRHLTLYLPNWLQHLL